MRSEAPAGRIVLDLHALWTRRADTARHDLLAEYEADALSAAGRGHDVVITGAAPVWLYLRIAHALHGVVRSLTYLDGQGYDVTVFDHAAD